MSTRTQTLDLSALKYNQAVIMTFTLLGFVLNQPIFPTFVAVVLVAGFSYLFYLFESFIC